MLMIISFKFVEGDVYAGTVADFTEVDPLIHRWDSLRTTQYDLKYLNGNDSLPRQQYIKDSYLTT